MTKYMPKPMTPGKPMSKAPSAPLPNSTLGGKPPVAKKPVRVTTPTSPNNTYPGPPPIRKGPKTPGAIKPDRQPKGGGPGGYTR